MVNPNIDNQYDLIEALKVENLNIDDYDFLF